MSHGGYWCAGSASASTQRSHSPPNRARADAGHEAPAPLAFHTAAPSSTSTVTPSTASAAPMLSVEVRHDEAASAGRRGAARAARPTPPCAVTAHVRRERVADHLVLALLFERGVDLFAHLQQRSQRCAQRLVLEAVHAREGLEVYRARGAAREVPPQVVGGHRQDRRQQARQPVADEVHRGLRRAPRVRPRAQRVHPVLGHVHVERAQVHGDQRVQRLRHGGEVVLVVRLQHARRGVGVARQREPVHLVHAARRAPCRWPDRSRRGWRRGCGTCSAACGRSRPRASGSPC